LAKIECLAYLMTLWYRYYRPLSRYRSCPCTCRCLKHCCYFTERSHL